VQTQLVVDVVTYGRTQRYLTAAQHSVSSSHCNKVPLKSRIGFFDETCACAHPAREGRRALRGRTSCRYLTTGAITPGSRSLSKNRSGEVSKDSAVFSGGSCRRVERATIKVAAFANLLGPTSTELADEEHSGFDAGIRRRALNDIGIWILNPPPGASVSRQVSAFSFWLTLRSGEAEGTFPRYLLSELVTSALNSHLKLGYARRELFGSEPPPPLPNRGSKNRPRWDCAYARYSIARPAADCNVDCRNHWAANVKKHKPQVPATVGLS